MSVLATQAAVMVRITASLHNQGVKLPALDIARLGARAFVEICGALSLWRGLPQLAPGTLGRMT